VSGYLSFIYVEFDCTLIFFVRRRFITTYSGADKILFKRNRIQYLQLRDDRKVSVTVPSARLLCPPLCTCESADLYNVRLGASLIFIDRSFTLRFASRLVDLFGKTFSIVLLFLIIYYSFELVAQRIIIESYFDRSRLFTSYLFRIYS